MARAHHGVFIAPILDAFLLYAPLHGLAALIDGVAARRVRDALECGTRPTGALAEIGAALAAPPAPAPRSKTGDFVPAFLGLLPTRACNLACRYCGFLSPGEADTTMRLELARDAVTWYVDTAVRTGTKHLEVHYFGGEPFCAPEILDLTVPLARRLARDAGCTVRFEAATNGTFDAERARWTADHLDTIVLSLDGPPEIHDRHRPRRDGTGSWDTVARNAGILSEGSAELDLRACVTADTVAEVPAIAAWFCAHFRPGAVSFEPLQPSAQSRAAGLEPPDPWTFARQCVAAARVLEAQGVEPIYAAADIRTRRVSFCPAGNDVAIVSAGGTVSACYLLERDWQAQGLDLRLGRIDGGTAQLDPAAVARARGLDVTHKPGCARCLCQWHCAGGCHVNHRPAGPGREYDRLCIQTRIVTLRNILAALGHDALATEWLRDREETARTVNAETDLLSEARLETAPLHSHRAPAVREPQP